MSTPTIHKHLALGAGEALVAETNYVDAKTKMVNSLVFDVMTKLADRLMADSKAMSDQLEKDRAEQQQFVDEWSSQKNPGDDWDTFFPWLDKYLDKDPVLKKWYDDRLRDFTPDPMSIYRVATQRKLWMLDGFQKYYNKDSPHVHMSDWMTFYQKQYNTDNLNGQNLTSASQKHVDLWSNTIKDNNNSSAQDYKLMESPKSIFAFLTTLLA